MSPPHATVLLGASGTIGSAIARRLVAAGGRVLLVGRDATRLAPLAEELGQPSLVADYTAEGALVDAVTGAMAAEPFTAVVNCAGSLLLKPAHTTSDAELQGVLAANLLTAFRAVQVGAKVLRQGGGSVVLFSSAAAEVGIANHEAIAAAKGAVAALARSAAATYAPRNIRVNAVSPGLVRTDMTRRVWESPTAAAASEALHALGRLGSPEHVASLVAWLVDPANDWITGQVLGLDGGLGRVLPKR